jgi:hypothetical protein
MLTKIPRLGVVSEVGVPVRQKTLVLVPAMDGPRPVFDDQVL